MSHTGNGTTGWLGVTINGDLESCWLCRRPVATQALRCASCGALQPLHDINYFALLGLDERFDLDLADLERHYASARRTLDPERVAINNPKAGPLVERYAELTVAAYDTLRDPMTRARYLLDLLDAVNAARRPANTDFPHEAPAANEVAAPPPELDALTTAINTAIDCPTIDRLGTQIGQEIEGCVHTLSSAFRAGRIGEARLALAHLDRLQGLSTTARKRRTDLCPPPMPPT